MLAPFTNVCGLNILAYLFSERYNRQQVLVVCMLRSLWLEI